MLKPDLLTFERPTPLALGFRLLIVLATAAAVCLLLLNRVEWINGTAVFRWMWQWVASGRVYPAMLLAAAPAVAAQWVSNRFAALVLIAGSLLGLQLVAVGIEHDPWSLHRMAVLVQSIVANSYFTDAQRLEQAPSLAGWVGHFPELSAFVHLHAREKAPGQILYYLAWIRLYGQSQLERAAIVSGIGGMVLTALAVPTTYGLARVSGLTTEAAKAAATFLAMMPGFVLIQPQFDSIHAVFTGLIVGSWLLALACTGWKSRSVAIACGLFTAAASFLAYATLTLGAMCAAVAMVYLRRSKLSVRQVAEKVGFVLLGVGLPYLLLWGWCGFDPFRMYQAAAANEKINLSTIPVSHAYPRTLPADIKDFMLASGWMSLPLIGMGLWRVRTASAAAVVWIAAGQIIVVWVSGLLRAETARIWLFLQPLALLPIGVELAAWPRWARVVAFAALAVVTACMAQNLNFVFAPGAP